MIAVDSNILVYAHRRDSEWHEAAKTCIRGLSESPAAWAIPWTCVHEFLSVVTRERVFAPPTTLPKALEQVASWLGSPSLVLLSESEGYEQVLANVLTRSKVTGSKIHDARVAAVCLHHGVRELLTADRDFSRFHGLKIRNPLIS
jgi:toxin-antitoxin system PIN domain toxin